MEIIAVEEMLDILNEAGRLTGKRAAKSEVHRQGLWHRVVHLCVTDGKGNIFQQRRGNVPHVRILPSVWDLFVVAGHIAAGEDPRDALLRKTKEKIGIELSADELHKGRFDDASVTKSEYWVEDPSYVDGGFYHRTIDYNFVVRLPEFNLGKLSLQFPKVIGVRRYSVKELKRDLKQHPASELFCQHANRMGQDDRMLRTVLKKVATLTNR